MKYINILYPAFAQKYSIQTKGLLISPNEKGSTLVDFN